MVMAYWAVVYPEAVVLTSERFLWVSGKTLHWDTDLEDVEISEETDEAVTFAIAWGPFPGPFSHGPYYELVIP